MIGIPTICALIVISISSIAEAGLSNADVQTVLNSHNYYRQQVALGKVSGQPKAANMKRLRYDTELEALAQKLTDKKVWAHDTSGRTSKYSNYGQNLYMAMSSNKDTASKYGDAVKSWFNEVYNPGFPASSVDKYVFSSGTGHYSQVVWANTESVGCASTLFYEGGWWKNFICCNYGPPGNYQGQSVYIRGEPCTKCSNGCKTYDGMCD